MLEEIKQKMQTALSHLKDEFAQIRTGRATPNLVSDIEVEAYGAKMTVKELAQISAPEPTIILISPWDKSIITNISTGISKSNLGFNPVVDGDIIRITVPSLTAERREALIKQMHQISEKYKVEVRQIRHEYIEQARDDKKSGKIGEDEEERKSKEIQKIHDDYIEQIDEAVKGKEEQLREV